jgi:hypothetical protein
MEDMVTVISDMKFVATTFMYVLLGFFTHIIKKNLSDGVDWIRYLKEHQGRTWLAVGAGVVSWLNLLVFRPDASPAEFLAIGYIIDSIFNKAPVSDETKAKIEALDERIDAKDSRIISLSEEARKVEEKE